MRRIDRLLLLLLPAVLFALGPAFGGDVNFFAGAKKLNSTDWEGFDKQVETGLETTWGPGTWPIRIAADVLVSTGSRTEDGRDVNASTVEMALGVRKIWDSGRTRPYVGGGLAIVMADRETVFLGPLESEDNAVAGWWVGAGVFRRIRSHFNLGVCARYSSGRTTLFGSDIQAGGVHLGLLVGWGWPAPK